MIDFRDDLSEGDAIDTVIDFLVQWSRGSLTDDILDDWPVDRVLRLADHILASSKTNSASS